MSIELSIRKTHRYVGTCQHEDKWESVASCIEIGKENLTVEDEDDYCESTSHRLWLKVDSDASEADIKQAIHDSHTQHGCHHEYDCCGCWSYYARDVKHEGGPIWSVIVNSSRNF